MVRQIGRRFGRYAVRLDDERDVHHPHVHDRHPGAAGDGRHADYRLGPGEQANSLVGLRHRWQLWRGGVDDRGKPVEDSRTNTLSDGRKATAIQIIKKIDDNSFTFESIGRQVDGELLPNVEPITIVRKTKD